MNKLDLTPFWRSSVGFDRLFDMMENEALHWSGEANYPPYNIERAGEDRYKVTLALAGFTPDEITVTAENNTLTVEGHKTDKTEHDYLYHGISARAFRRQFNLAEFVEVKGAHWANGLLTIDLVREVPEAMKPRQIAISSGQSPSAPMHQLGAKKAA